MRHKQTRLFDQYKDRLSAYKRQHDIDVSVEEMLLAITEADPDQAQFKNSKWLINNLLNKKFLWEDIEPGRTSKAFDTLDRFLKIRKQWPENNFRDINQYQGLSSIAEKIRPFEIQKTSGDLKREERAKVYDETIVVYDKDNYLIVIPKTELASCYWGRNTEWCTASTQSKNHFERYNKNGPLIIAITPDNRKYQFHCTCNPMDENDSTIYQIEDPILIALAKATGKVLNIKYRDWNDPEFCRLAIKEDLSLIQNISPDLPEYREICESIINRDGQIIRFISPDTPDYFDLCKLAVQQNGQVIEYISPDTPGYSELCRLAVQEKSWVIELISKDIPEFIELCKIAVPTYGWIIQHISPDDPDYPELSELAVQSNGGSIRCIDLNVTNYSKLCKLAVSNDGNSIQDISHNTPDYFDICCLAVQQNGLAIRYIDPDMPGYFDVCKLAVQRHGFSIRHMNVNMPGYPELARLAVQQNGRAIQCIDTDLPNYLELCKLAVIQCSETINMLNKAENYNELVIIAEEVKKQEKKKEAVSTHIKDFSNPIADWIKNKEYNKILQRFETLSIMHEKTISLTI